MKLESKFQREQFALRDECEKLSNNVDDLKQSMAKKDDEIRQLREQLHLVNLFLFN